MSHLTKKHAQLKMDLGVVRVGALDGATVRESLDALMAHLENVDALERSQTIAAAPDTDKVEIKRPASR
ncbi:hypothetical protein [Shinella sp.]|uniref:hypothetical protein n=1 Tax=Shinella sp. TaxID=1870904 RepID=UPI00301C5987